MSRTVFAGIALALAVAARADTFVGYAELRVMPELGRIEIGDGIVRGAAPVRRATKNAAALLQRGIALEAGRREVELSRRIEMDGRRIDVRISVSPPLGHGYGGGNWEKRVEVAIDGRKKVDCTLGYLARQSELDVHEIVLFPSDGLLSVTGERDAGERTRVPLDVPTEIQFLNESTVITDDLLAPLPAEHR
jgi:hypothetical protein